MAFHGQQYTLPVYGYHAWWRGADLTLHLRLPPAGREAAAVAAPARSVAVQGAAPQLPPRSDRVGLSGRALRHDAPRSGQGRCRPRRASCRRSSRPPQGERDLHRLGREVSEHLRVGVENAIAARARIGEERFLDVHHRELIADPMGTRAARLRLPRPRAAPGGRAGDRSTGSEANRSGAHGTHRYTAEQFGLSAAQLRSDYDFYIRHFDVAVEG